MRAATYFSVFSGSGGFELGIGDRARPIDFAEIDVHASEVLRHHWTWVRNWGVVVAIDWTAVSDFDLLLGGSPCQDSSVSSYPQRSSTGQVA